MPSQPASFLARAILGLLLVCTSPLTAALPIGEPPPAKLGDGPNFTSISTDQFAGKVLVVTFWASWCGPCLNEMTAMERLQRAAPERIAVVSVNIESPTRFREVRRVLSKELTVTLTHDGRKDVQPAWGVGRIPHMFMVDHTGRLAYEHVGYGESFIPRLVEQVNELLARQAAATGAD